MNRIFPTLPHYYRGKFPTMLFGTNSDASCKPIITIVDFCMFLLKHIHPEIHNICAKKEIQKRPLGFQDVLCRSTLGVLRVSEEKKNKTNYVVKLNIARNC